MILGMLFLGLGLTCSAARDHRNLSGDVEEVRRGERHGLFLALNAELVYSFAIDWYGKRSVARIAAKNVDQRRSEDEERK